MRRRATTKRTERVKCREATVYAKNVPHSKQVRVSHHVLGRARHQAPRCLGQHDGGLSRGRLAVAVRRGAPGPERPIQRDTPANKVDKPGAAQYRYHQPPRRRTRTEHITANTERLQNCKEEQIRFPSPVSRGRLVRTRRRQTRPSRVLLPPSVSRKLALSHGSTEATTLRVQYPAA